jgi:ribosome recycling factor
MSTDPDTILLEAEDAMSKAEDYLLHEFRGIRTGRATTALVEYIKVDYYGASTDLKSIASITVPEPTQLLIKPFDAGAIQEIKKAIETSGLSLNPLVEGKQIRLNVPALTGEQRTKLVSHLKKLAEDAKVVLRNARRDANKHADAIGKGSAHVSEDEVKTLKEEIQELLKKYEKEIEEKCAAKSKEITEV